MVGIIKASPEAKLSATRVHSVLKDWRAEFAEVTDAIEYISDAIEHANKSGMWQSDIERVFRSPFGEYSIVKYEIAACNRAGQDILKILSEDEDYDVRKEVASNSTTSEKTLREMKAEEEDSEILEIIDRSLTLNFPFATNDESEIVDSEVEYAMKEIFDSDVFKGKENGDAIVISKIVDLTEDDIGYGFSARLIEKWKTEHEAQDRDIDAITIGDLKKEISEFAREEAYEYIDWENEREQFKERAEHILEERGAKLLGDNYGGKWKIVASGIGWRKLDGGKIIDGTGDDLIEALSVNGEFSLNFHNDDMDGNFRVVRYSHDEPTGACFEFIPISKRDIRFNEMNDHFQDINESLEDMRLLPLSEDGTLKPDQLKASLNELIAIRNSWDTSGDNEPYGDIVFTWEYASIFVGDRGEGLTLDIKEQYTDPEQRLSADELVELIEKHPNIQKITINKKSMPISLHLTNEGNVVIFEE